MNEPENREMKYVKWEEWGKTASCAPIYWPPQVYTGIKSPRWTLTIIYVKKKVLNIAFKIVIVHNQEVDSTKAGP